MSQTPAESAPPTPLSSDQLAFFDREGYLMVEDVIPAPLLDGVAREVTGEIDRLAQGLVAEGKLSRTYAELPFETRLMHIHRETEAVFQGILAGRLALPAIFELYRCPALLDIAEQLCGPELIASSVYRLRPKLPGQKRSEVPWHQDSGYFEPYCDDALVLTVWLPLVDATKENGCLWVLPRAHQGPVLRHRQDGHGFYLEIPDEDLPRDEQRRPICVEVPRGGVLLLSNRTPHASFENRGDIVRWSMDLRYQSAKLPTNAAITRLEDEDTPGEEAPTACYPPEADFLIRSRRRPGEVVQDAEAFRRLREQHKPGSVTNRWRSNHIVS